MNRFTLSTGAIREAQERLARLGHDSQGDTPGVAGTRTTVALQAFQRQRGLRITGHLDAVTWDRLIEAGWALGDRLLFLSPEFQRGDDVAALQEALALLGFNPGRIDGIFGPLTAHALEEFQRNCALEPSSTLTRATLDELGRFASRAEGKKLVTEAHDHGTHLDEKRRRLVVVQGTGPLAQALCEQIAFVVPVESTGLASDAESSAWANREDAALLLSVRANSQLEGLELSYYASYQSFSSFGRRLATASAEFIAVRESVPVRISGMSLPILRETLMPTLVISLGDGYDSEVPLISEAIVTTIIGLFDRVR